MFKDRLKSLREQAGLTQKELGEKIYVSRSAVCKWEMGAGIPSDVNLEALCRLFSVSEDWLLDRKDIKNMVDEYSRKNKKMLLFILGIVLPLILIILSLLPIFIWRCKGEEVCITLYVSPMSIFMVLLKNNLILGLLPFLMYIGEITYTVIYWKKNFKYDKMIQIIALSLIVVVYIVTLITANLLAIEKGFSLLFF